MIRRLIILFTIMLLGVSYSQTKHFIGGVTLSKVAGDSADDIEELAQDNNLDFEWENLLGFKLGMEISQDNGYVYGITYTQRGYEYQTDGILYGVTYEGNELFTINYLTGYAYKPIYNYSPNIDLIVGGELGYFLIAHFEAQADVNGEEILDEDKDIDMDDWDDGDGNKWNYGLIIGGRYHISQKISVIGTYYWGLTEWSDDLEFTDRSFQFYIRTSF